MGQNIPHFLSNTILIVRKTIDFNTINSLRIGEFRVIDNGHCFTGNVFIPWFYDDYTRPANLDRLIEKSLQPQNPNHWEY